MLTIPNGRGGIRIPGWAIGATLLIIAVLSTGFTLGRTWNDTQRSVRDLNARMCRIEQALNIPLWPTCPQGSVP